MDRITINLTNNQNNNDNNNNNTNYSSSSSNQGEDEVVVYDHDDDENNPANNSMTTTTTTTTSTTAAEDDDVGDNNNNHNNINIADEIGNDIINDSIIIDTANDEAVGQPLDCDTTTRDTTTNTTTSNTADTTTPANDDDGMNTTTNSTNINDPTSSSSSSSSDSHSSHHSINSISLQSASESQRISELRSILPDASDEQLISILRENDRASQITRQSADDAIFAATAFANEEAEAAAAAVAAVAAAEAAESAAVAAGGGGGERLSRTSDSSGGGGASIGGGGGGASTGMRGSLSSIDSRSRRSWRPCQPPILSYSHYQHHHHHNHHHTSSVGGVVVGATGGGGSSSGMGTGLDNGTATTTTTSEAAATGSTNNTVTIHGIEYDLGRNTENNDELEVRRIEIVSQMQEELCSKFGYNLCESGLYEEMERIHNEWETMLSTTTSSSAATLLTTTTTPVATTGADAPAEQAAGVGGHTPATTNSTDGGSLEGRGRKKLLPNMVKWDAPPLSRRSLMEREPVLPEVRNPLPLPPALAGERERYNNNHSNSEGSMSNMGTGGRRRGGLQESINSANGEICVGTILVDPPTAAPTEHSTVNDNEEQKREESAAAGGHVNGHNSADHSPPLGPYDLAIRCIKCRVILKVQFDVGLVVCPQCRTINQTTLLD